MFAILSTLIGLIKKPLISLSFFFLIFSAKVCATNYYVAVNGSNGNNGTSIATPFLTIQKASDVAVSGDVVNVRAGTYREMVNLKANGVNYQPYNGEIVTINGTDLMLSWILTSGTTYQTTMNWDMSGWGSNQLFADSKMIELARWPDQTSTDIVMPTNATADAVSASGNSFTITDADFNEPNGRWTGAKIWVNLAHNGVDGQGWTGVVSSTNQSAHTITVDFGEAPRLGDQPWGLGISTEYFLFDPTSTGVNATGGVNALLSNGEWWKSGTTLYVKTTNGSAPSSTGGGINVIEAKHRHFAFLPSITNKSNYTIKGFNIFACSITTDINAFTNRVIAEDAQNITLDGIIAKYPSHQTDMTGNWQDQHYAWSGLVVSGRNNTIQNCSIQYSATSALSIQGFGIKVLNNTIMDANYMCSNSGALNTGFICLNAEIANNTIFNTTVMAINFKYSQNSNINVRDVYRIHHNIIYNFMRRSGDSGGIDAALSDGQWIRIDHNTIYNNTPVLGTMVHGIYLDYGGGVNNDQGHFTLDHNIIYSVASPILLNNMTDVNIYNNVLLDNSDAHPIEGAAIGTNVKIYNNILSEVLNIRPDNLVSADIQHNVFDATGLKINSFFSNAVGGDLHLISTATSAINQGISVGTYDENVVGLPDLGAFEFSSSTDGTNPSTPITLASNTISLCSFNLTWAGSTDNLAVAYYEVYRNGIYYGSTTANSMTVNGLIPNTTYAMTVKAKDAAGNSSALSSSLNVTTSAATNIAPSGTAYRWSANSSSGDNTNRVNSAGINDGNLTNNINLNGGVDDNGYAFESAGIVFAAAQNNVTSINFIQGDVDANANSCFTASLTLQFSQDGTTWNNSTWKIDPTYAYGNSVAGKTFVFFGDAVSNIKGIRICGQVHTNDSSWVASVKEVRAYTAASGGSSSGTGYYWLNMTSATSNATRVVSTGINDNNLSSDVVVPDNNNANQWQGAGMTWATAKANITKVEYYSGTQLNNGTDNGCFTAGIQLQYSTTGTSWINVSGWSISPAYPYNTSSSDQVYTFTGPALPSTCKGVRVIGQVFTNNISWAIHVKEVRVYNGNNVLQRSVNSMQEISNINSHISVYPNPVINGIFNLGLDPSSINKPLTVMVTDVSGKTVLQSRFVSNGNSQRIDAGKLIAGIYFVNVFSEKSTVVTKIVVGSTK